MSMKRGAENYITKDDGPHDDAEEEESSEGFQKAEDAVLATRIIRGLPKRAGGSPAPPPSTNSIGTTDASPSTKFSGFSGFGSSSNSFPFTPPTQPSILPSTSPRPVSSGSSFIFPSNPPAVASTASNTAKTFASFIADSSSSRPAATPPAITPPSTAEDQAAVKYFTSLRGLNVSFLAALSLAVEKDPFTDVTTVFDRYKSLRSTAQTEFDARPSTSTNVSSVSAAPNPKPPSAQAPPAFSGFSSSSSNSSTAIGTTLPKASLFTSSSGFSFPSSLSTSEASSGTFAPPVTTTGSTTLFGSSFSNTSGTSPFGSSSTLSSNTTAFGSSALSTSTLFGNDKPANSSSPFGTTQSSSSKPNSFGSFVSFGKPAGSGGSLGNPVGFGFGGPSGTPESDADGGVGFKSGGSPDTAEARNSESNEATPQPDGERRDDVANPGLLGTNPHDEEGEGEEQEDTAYSVKLRAFRLKKAEEKGGAGWAELGYGILRLKKHKETEARRMLLRNSSTGKININFSLYAGLKPSQTKKTVTFVGHDTGVSQTYSVRLQTEDQAAKLKEVLEKEVLLIKGGTDNTS